jgi:RNA polymerase sigma-70 factor (ECF subfamily)
MSGEISGTASPADWAFFDATVMPHLDAAFRLALWLTHDRDEAQDLVQETCAQALQSIHRFTPGTNARAWVFAILRHVRSNRLRKQGRAPVTVDVEDQLDTLPAVESTPQHLTDDDVLGALATLPAGYQEVVLLADVEEFTYKEIATMLDVPVGTVMSRLHRARRMLRVALVERAPRAAWRAAAARQVEGRRS